MTPKGYRWQEGRRKGAYTQTTGAWVRGILQDDYGVDANGITWVHDRRSASRRIPGSARHQAARCRRLKTIPKMQIEGETVAAIVGDTISGSAPQILSADHEAANKRFADGETAACRINHMYVVRQSLSGKGKERPDVVREAFRMLVDSAKPRRAARAPRWPRAFASVSKRVANRSAKIIDSFATSRSRSRALSRMDELFDAHDPRALKP